MLLISSRTDEEAHDQQRLVPVVEYGEGERDGHRRRDPGADVRNEAQHHGERAPEHPLGTPRNHRPAATHDSLPGVDERLHQQIAADALRGVAQRLGGGAEVLRAEQADHAVAQIGQPQQHEDGEDDHDRGRADGLDDRARGDCVSASMAVAARRPPATVCGCARGRRRRRDAVDLAGELLHGFGGAGHAAAHEACQSARLARSWRR